MSLHYPDFLKRKFKGALKSSNNIDILDKGVDLISINVTESSPFNTLASPILQREILHQFYNYLSNGKSLSYEVTCQILQLMSEKSNLGKREKVLNLDKNVSAIKIGNFLQLKICTENNLDVENTKVIEKLKKFGKNDTDDDDDDNKNDGDVRKEVRKIDLNLEEEKAFHGLTYICEKVCYSLIFFF